LEERKERKKERNTEKKKGQKREEKERDIRNLMPTCDKFVTLHYYCIIFLPVFNEVAFLMRHNLGAGVSSRVNFRT
jgi:hypothetical protein